MFDAVPWSRDWQPPAKWATTVFPFSFDLRKGVAFSDRAPFDATTAEWNLKRWMGVADFSWIGILDAYDRIVIDAPDKITV